MRIDQIEVKGYYYAQVNGDSFVSKVKVMNKTACVIVVKTQFKHKQLTPEEIIAPIIRPWWRRINPFFSLDD